MPQLATIGPSSSDEDLIAAVARGQLDAIYPSGDGD